MRRIVISVFVLSLCTTLASAQTPEQKKATIKFVQDLQVGDGGFVPAPVDGRLDQNPKGSLRATSSALRALKHFGGAANDKKACEKFVQNCFDAQSGGFCDQPGGKPDVFTTAVGLMAVGELKLPMKNYSKAIQFLSESAKDFEDIRIAAAGFEAFENAGGGKPKVSDPWLPLVKIYGAGMGKRGAREYASVLVTVERLDPRFSGNTPAKVTAYVSEVLDERQNKDGAFGKAETHESDLESSYRVMRGYHMFKSKPAKAEALREFVAKCRNSDGGYGVQPGKPSQVSGTYFASIILHWLNEK